MDSLKILLSTLGSLFEIILGVLFFYLMRIYFDIEVIGYYGAIYSFLMAFSFITKLGFAIAHLKYFSEAKNLDEEAICNGTFLCFNLIQYSIYIIIIVSLIPIIPINKEDLKIVYVMFLVTLLILIGQSSFDIIFLSKKYVIKKSFPMIMSSLLKIILLITLKNLFFADIWLLANILFIANLTYFIINCYFLKNLKLKKPTLKYGKKYLKYSFPFFIVTSLSIIIDNIDILMVNAWFPIEQVANYFTAKQIYGYMFIFVYNIMNILISTFVKNINLGKNEYNLLIIKKTHKFLNLLIVPLIFLITLYSTEILTFFFGENYRLTGLILSILVFNVMLISNYCAIETQLRALGEVNFLAKISIIRTILAIILMIIFISPEFLNMGATGGALAIVFTEIIAQIIIRPIIFKKYGLGFYWGLFRNLAIMLGIFILQLYINTLFFYPLYFIPIFMLFNISLYFFINYLLKGFSKKDLSFFLKTINIKNILESISLELKDKR